VTGLALARRTAARYRVRTTLAIVGVAVIGALNFDMLLLSRGLVLSFADMIGSTGFDVRVAAGSGLPALRLPIEHAASLVADVRRLPEVKDAAMLQTDRARLWVPDHGTHSVTLVGASQSSVSPGWTLVDGRTFSPSDTAEVPPLIVTRQLASEDGVQPGAVVEVRANGEGASLQPPVRCRVVGIADFTFESNDELTVATTVDGFRTLHGGQVQDDADVVLAASTPDAGVDAAVAAIAKLRPDLHAFSNAELVQAFNENGFAYFRQISLVLSVTTALFTFMLVGVLLTVSANQRLGEIAALRAIGIARRRVAAMLLWESALLVGVGGLLALPLGGALAVVLDGILRDGAGGCGLSDAAGNDPSDRAHAAPRGGRMIIDARALRRVFPMPAGPVEAVRDVSIQVAPGAYMAISGPSGCGKSTLLQLLGCVDVPTSGSLAFEGRDVGGLNEDERSRIRLRRVGFVFQRFFLLPMLTAWENIELPQSEAGVPAADRRARTRELLEYVGLADRADHLPSQLSGGEMQRIAVARALANRPALLLADEPTGELDEQTGEHVADLFDRVNRDGTAIVLVTHNAALAGRASQRLTMRSGAIEVGG
jgi:putative ABC transport system ATP-binding protein